jgi:hypothetical protein
MGNMTLKIFLTKNTKEEKITKERRKGSLSVILCVNLLG